MVDFLSRIKNIKNIFKTAENVTRAEILAYTEDVELLRKRAKANDVVAQRSLGNLYEKGIGVKKNLHMAEYWYARAAKQSESATSFKVEKTDSTNKQQEKDCCNKEENVTRAEILAYTEDIELLRKRAKADDAVAQRSLGNLYEKGIGVKKNLHMAEYWYARAAKQSESVTLFKVEKADSTNKQQEKDCCNKKDVKAGLITMSNPVIVYCPFEQRRLVLNSNIIDSMNEFLMFILEAIHDQKTIGEIKDVTNFKNTVVDENIDYLEKIGFITRNEDCNLVVTKEGISYIKFKSIIDKFNDCEHRVAINMFTGKVASLPVCIPQREMIDVLKVLPIKVNSFITQNEDYENSKEFVFNKFDELFTELTEEQRQSINVTCIRMNKENNKVTFIMPYKLKSIPDINYKNEGKNKIAIRRVIKSYQCQYINRDLDSVRGKIKIAKELKSMDSTMISAKAERLILLEEYEQGWNEKVGRIIRDESTGEFLDAIPKSNVNNKLLVIDLDSGEFNDFGECSFKEVDGSVTDYSYVLIEKEKNYYMQVVDFEDFEVVEDGN